MKTAIRFLFVTMIVGSSLAPASAQDTQPYKPSGVYNIKFVVSELENGKVTNQRTYTALVREERKGMLKTGNRVPIATGSSRDNAANISFQYLDVGFNADFNVSEREGKIDLDLSGDLSSIAPPDPNSPTPGNNPILRHVTQAVNTSLVEGRPTVVASLDDVSTKKTVQLEVTVTRIKKGATGL